MRQDYGNGGYANQMRRNDYWLNAWHLQKTEPLYPSVQNCHVASNVDFPENCPSSLSGFRRFRGFGCRGLGTGLAIPFAFWLRLGLFVFVDVLVPLAFAVVLGAILEPRLHVVHVFEKSYVGGHPTWTRKARVRTEPATLFVPFDGSEVWLCHCGEQPAHGRPATIQTKLLGHHESLCHKSHDVRIVQVETNLPTSCHKMTQKRQCSHVSQGHSLLDELPHQAGEGLRIPHVLKHIALRHSSDHRKIFHVLDEDLASMAPLHSRRGLGRV